MSGRPDSTSRPGAGRAALHRWRHAFAFAAVVLLLAAVTAYGVREHRSETRARERLNRGLDVQRAALLMENSSALMEAHQRGFLVNGDERAARDRDAAYRAGLAQASRLAQLVRGTPEQARNVREMEVAFRSRYIVMRRVAAAARRDGIDAARAAFSLQGIASVDPVLASIGAMRREQRRIVVEASEQAAAASRRATVVVVYGTGLGLGLLMLSAWLLVRQLDRNEHLRRQLEAANALERARSEALARSNRELEAFSYTISHDLRAPLRHIDGYARMLQEDAGEQLDAEMRRYLDTISDSARRMGMLIDDLLAYARLGRKPLECVRVDMHALTGQIVSEILDTQSTAQVNIAPMPDAHADPVLLRQAWVNLLSNAVKYSAPRGPDARIDIAGEAVEGRVRYRIRDNGVGFDMRYADKLFRVFQRLHTQEQFEGTGVGLAIVRQVVERHGGSIWADAAPGEGATFFVELPAGATA